MRKIVAVARKVWAEAFHNRAALVLILVFVGLLPALPFFIKGDGTQKGQIQIVLTYTFLLANFLICVLTALLSASTVCAEIERKEIHITAAKPIRRWQFLLGKWLGVVSLDVALLAVIGAVTYGVTLYAARPLRGREAEHDAVWKEVLVCRKVTVAPPIVPPDAVKKAAAEEFEKRKAQRRLPQGKTRQQILAELEEQITKYARTIPPGVLAQWKIEGLHVPSDPDASVYLRFKYDSSRGRPAIGKYRIRCRWFAGGKGVARPFQDEADWTTGTFHELRIPAGALGSDGTLALGFVHFDPQQWAVFPEDGVQILQPAGPFVRNYVSSLFVILCEAAFIAAFGVACGTFCSFPVTVLGVSFVLFMGLAGHNIAAIAPSAQLMEVTPAAGPGAPSQMPWVNTAFRGFLKGMTWVFPKFHDYYPVEHLISGRLIPARTLLEAALLLVLVKGGIVGLLGYVIYVNRELARVIA